MKEHPSETVTREYLAAYPQMTEQIPPREIKSGRFTVRFARNGDDLDRVQRLRYEVFNLELGEGLESSHATGRDEDEFDPFYHHLMVIKKSSDLLVGTYRMQTGEMAKRFIGFYAEREFTVADLPDEVLDKGVELGRACIHKGFRNRNVLFNLYQGLGLYLLHNQKRFLFGCASLTSQNPEDGRNAFAFLQSKGHLHSEISIEPKEEYRCFAGNPGPWNGDHVSLPPLFSISLVYNAKVCGLPAIDREFKTIDFFFLFDLTTMDTRVKNRFLRYVPGV